MIRILIATALLIAAFTVSAFAETDTATVSVTVGNFQTIAFTGTLDGFTLDNTGSQTDNVQSGSPLLTFSANHAYTVTCNDNDLTNITTTVNGLANGGTVASNGSGSVGATAAITSVTISYAPYTVTSTHNETLTFTIS